MIGLRTSPTKGAPPPPDVVVDVPVMKEVREYEEFVGQLMAENTVEVRARVIGHLDKVNFVDGSEVAKDGVLFVIDPWPYQAEVARTLASIG